MTARPGSSSGSSACPVRVDVALALGQPEGELEGRVAERARDRVADLRGRRRRAELHDQIRHGGAVQSRAQEAGEERERRSRERHEADPASRTLPAVSDAPPSATTVTAASRSPSRLPLQSTGASARRAGPSHGASVGRAARRLRHERPPSDQGAQRARSRRPDPGIVVGRGAGCAGSPGNRVIRDSRRAAPTRGRRAGQRT